MVDTIKHFEAYLYGWHFHVYTDNVALKGLLTSDCLNKCLWRHWCLYLLNFTFCVHYRSGWDNVVVDSLTCQGWTDRDDAGEGEDDSESQVSQTSMNNRKSRQAYEESLFSRCHLPRGGGGVMWETLPHKPQEDHPHKDTVLDILSMPPFTV